MNGKMEQDLIKLIEHTLFDKINKNEDFIRYSFYELRVKYNLTEYETEKFLELLRNRLFYLEYKTYMLGDRYYYDDKEKVVEDNELLIAIKVKK